MNKKKLPKAIRPEAAEEGGAGGAPVADKTASARPAGATETTRPVRAGKGASVMTQESPSPEMASADERRAAAEKVVERYSLYSGAAGLIPVPGVDLATVGGVQIQMLRRLSQIYDVPFSENRGKALIAALAGSMIPAASGMGAVSLIKGVPVAGTVVAVWRCRRCRPAPPTRSAWLSSSTSPRAARCSISTRRTIAPSSRRARRSTSRGSWRAR